MTEDSFVPSQNQNLPVQPSSQRCSSENNISAVQPPMKRILDCITEPSQLSCLTNDELNILAHELREEIISVTAKTGGHVASSLGAIEIIVAVHSLINSPTDKFVFDVGHQAYAHKLLTGRLQAFPTLRSFGGISGFTNPAESKHDVHAAGHASDSLSIALGLAKARAIRGSNEKIVALIGDAGISGGMAFEALNIIGQMQLPLVIILNDNEMSISKNVGALMKHLGALRSSDTYRNTRDATQRRLEAQGKLGSAAVNVGRSMKDSVKQLFLPQSSMIYEQLGIVCTPPLNGHNIEQLRDFLRMALATNGPVLMHVVTHKGEGFAPAIQNPVQFHGVGAYNPQTGEVLPKPAQAPSYTSVFSDALVNEGRSDNTIVAITAAMRGGTGTEAFFNAFPDRSIDVGIAEENAVGMAAGLAIAGMKPVVAIYSTFLQRAFDQIIIDNALINTNVVFAIDRAGLVGADGATHHGVFDIAYLRMIPQLKILAPSNEAELVCALHTALATPGVIALRYPRGNGWGVEIPSDPYTFEVGKSHTVRDGSQIAVLAFGEMVKVALDAAEMLEQHNMSVRVVDMRWVKPLDEQAIIQAAQTQLVVSIEDGVIAGGVGEEVQHVLVSHALQTPSLVLGIEDEFVPHGSPADLMKSVGLDASAVAQRILQAYQVTHAATSTLPHTKNQ